jgi:hypothetical protein
MREWLQLSASRHPERAQRVEGFGGRRIAI